MGSSASTPVGLTSQSQPPVQATPDQSSTTTTTTTTTAAAAAAAAAVVTQVPQRQRRVRPNADPDSQPTTKVVLERKPVLYIFSPGSEIDVTVTLTLTTPGLRFSALYPVVPINLLKQRTGVVVVVDSEQVRWTVRTRRDGTLLHTDTGLEISYLFWETEAKNGAPPLSPPHSPFLGHHSPLEHFNPFYPDINDRNSVVLSVTEVTPYLDRTLKVLGLHTEARTSFITFWLPFMLKHEFVALRFLPQSAYECSAPLSIEPKPDVVTRIFMLFKSVEAEYVHPEWSTAIARASEEVTWWRDVVGVETDRAQDSTLYRILEWGGMEVA